MGRPLNVPRAEAKAAGLRFYTAVEACEHCFDDQRYVSNAACVTCTINAGKTRYAALDDDAREAQRQREHARYLQKAKRKAARVVEAIKGFSDDSDFV